MYPPNFSPPVDVGHCPCQRHGEPSRLRAKGTTVHADHHARHAARYLARDFAAKQQ